MQEQLARLLGYVPSQEPSHGRFQGIIENSACVFAHRSINISAPRWNTERDLQFNLRNIRASFYRFVELSSELELDGFIIEIPEAIAGTNLTKMGGLLHHILRDFSEHDPANENCMSEEIESPQWWFKANGQRVVVLVFASFYDSTHPRHTGGLPFSYILFQPIHTFERRARNEVLEISTEARERIRAVFAAQGRPYDETISLSSFEAYKFLKPMRVGEAPIRWWQLNYGD